jgi:hypothetical protein
VFVGWGGKNSPSIVIVERSNLGEIEEPLCIRLGVSGQAWQLRETCADQDHRET